MHNQDLDTTEPTSTTHTSLDQPLPSTQPSFGRRALTAAKRVAPLVACAGLGAAASAFIRRR